MKPEQKLALEGIVGAALTDEQVAAIEPLLDPENRNDVQIAAALSVGRVKLLERFISERGVIALLGTRDGDAFLRALEDFGTAMLPAEHPLKADQAGIRRVIGWLRTEAGVDLGVPASQMLLGALGATGVVNAAHAAQVAALAQVADPISYNAVSTALNLAEGRPTL